jgi:hypothetical protein
MIDWEALRRNMPKITEQLTEMMVDEAIPTLIDGEFEATPAVALTLTGEPRSIFVIAAVNVALGCLGTMIAILTPKRIQ